MFCVFLYNILITTLVLSVVGANGNPICDLRAKTEYGWICGLRRIADDGSCFASFLGVPYAKQPLGELRFAELQPPEPWNYTRDATTEGPICPQHDQVYGNLVRPYRHMAEACIHANIHVPEFILPWNNPLCSENSNSGDYFKCDGSESIPTSGAPILVFIHGGGFQAGSSDTDLHGPEYLVSKGIIVVTFNYRINVFGFLSLNTPQVPGNAGLRDMLTFLRWVKRNARYFGGDPDNVTLMGQSAGAASVHLLSLSESSKGLFKSASPVYAQTVATMLFTHLGINSTNPNDIHKQLISMPLEKILEANSIVQFHTGLTSFVPVVEGVYPGVTRVIDAEPIDLIKRGRGKEYPMMLGFTNSEIEFFRWRLQYLDIIGRIQNNTALLLNIRLIYSTPPNVSQQLGKKVGDKYFHGPPNLDDLIDIFRYNFFEYPAFKLCQWRSEIDSAPTFLYQYQYSSDLKILKDALMLVDYHGAVHVEDLTYVFRENQYLGEYGRLPLRDSLMKDWMVSFVYNFMICNNPTCVEGEHSPWPQVRNKMLNYQVISEPGLYYNAKPTPQQWDMIKFLDKIEEEASISALSTSTRV